jgi:WD40 repeat protein
MSLIYAAIRKKYVLKQGADWIKTIQLSQDLLVTSSGPRNWHELHVYKLSTGELQRKTSLESDVECVRFYDERQVVSAAAQLMMHDIETGQCALVFGDQKKGVVNAMAVEGSLVVCSHKGKKVRIWDVRSGRRVMTMATGHTHLLHDIGVVERNKHWTLPDSLGPAPASPRNIAGTQDRCLVAPLVTVSKDESVRLFDMRQLSVAAKPLAVLAGHKGPVRCVRMDAWKAVTGAKDGSVIVWDLTDPALLTQSATPGTNAAPAITGPGQLFNWLAAGNGNQRPVLRVKEPVYTLDFCDSVMFTGHTLLTLFDFDPHSSALTRFTNRRRSNTASTNSADEVDSLNVGSDRSCLIA